MMLLIGLVKTCCSIPKDAHFNTGLTWSNCRTVDRLNFKEKMTVVVLQLQLLCVDRLFMYFCCL